MKEGIKIEISISLSNKSFKKCLKMARILLMVCLL